MQLLFACAHWHGLAKLRMHSDLTLEILDDVTTTLGERFRHFQRDVCPSYRTRELPREASARRRRKKANAPGEADSEPLKKFFSLRTYKYHSLGDYVRTIRFLGTTDSFSTTVVSTTWSSSVPDPHNLTGRARTSQSKREIYPHRPQELCETANSDRATPSADPSH